MRSRLSLPAVVCCCLAALVAGGSGGCTTVTPPKNPKDPVAVYLCDYGVHSSLLLPTGRGEFVEYAWGDWGYSSKHSVGPHDALGALFLSGGSALGRRYHLSLQGQPPPVVNNGPDQVAKVVPIEAARDKVAGLVQELDERYRAGEGEPRYNPVNGMTYVRDSRHYSIFYNCNHLTKWCLWKLDCEVGGFTAHANFAVAAPPRRSGRAPAVSTAATAPPRPPTASTSKGSLKSLGDQAAPVRSTSPRSKPQQARAEMDLR